MGRKRTKKDSMILFKNRFRDDLNNKTGITSNELFNIVEVEKKYIHEMVKEYFPDWKSNEYIKVIYVKRKGHEHYVDYMTFYGEVFDFFVEKYKNRTNKFYKIREVTALSTIEQLIGRPLYKQFQVLNYRIDGYDPVDKIAYEIDEKHHESQQVEDAKRQEEIEHVLGCTFKRIKV